MGFSTAAFLVPKGRSSKVEKGSGGKEGTKKKRLIGKHKTTTRITREARIATQQSDRAVLTPIILPHILRTVHSCHNVIKLQWSVSLGRDNRQGNQIVREQRKSPTRGARERNGDPGIEKIWLSMTYRTEDSEAAPLPRRPTTYTLLKRLRDGTEKQGDRRVNHSLG